MKLLTIPSLAGIATNLQTSSSSATNICIMICGAVLAIGLVFLIYKVAQGDNGAKEALIGWFVAVIVYGIAVSRILNT